MCILGAVESGKRAANEVLHALGVDHNYLVRYFEFPWHFRWFQKGSQLSADCKRPQAPRDQYEVSGTLSRLNSSRNDKNSHISDPHSADEGIIMYLEGLWKYMTPFLQKHSKWTTILIFAALSAIPFAVYLKFVLRIIFNKTFLW